jgi:hypothetical protein
MKNIFVIFFLICATTISYCQELVEDEHPVYLGLRAGANASNFSQSDLDYKFGAYVSAFVHFKVTHFYRLQLEFGFSSQGGKSNNSAIEDLKADYFTIAPLNALYLNNSGFYFMVFPSFEFDLDNVNIYDTKSNGVNAFDIALGAGVGYELKSGITIETRFKHGLIPVDTPFFKSDNSDEVSKFNVVFQLGVSYKFKIKS